MMGGVAPNLAATGGENKPAYPDARPLSADATIKPSRRALPEVDDPPEQQSSGGRAQQLKAFCWRAVRLLRDAIGSLLKVIYSSL